MQIEMIQRRVRVSRLPLTKSANQSPMRSKLDTTRECPDAVSTNDPPRHAKLGHLLGSILRMHEIGRCVDGHFPLNAEGRVLTSTQTPSMSLKRARMRTKTHTLLSMISPSPTSLRLSRIRLRKTNKRCASTCTPLRARTFATDPLLPTAPFRKKPPRLMRIPANSWCRKEVALNRQPVDPATLATKSHRQPPPATTTTITTDGFKLVSYRKNRKQGVPLSSGLYLWRSS